MKIPKFEKDRTLTRRTVKGAAGGMKGVDYEDDRRPDAATVPKSEATPATKLKAEQLRTAHGEAAALARARVGGSQDEAGPRVSAPKEEQEMILDDEDATSRDTKAKQKRRAVVARDRFTVDKDAPDARRKVRWDLLSEDEESEPEDDDEVEIDVDEIANAAIDGPPPDARLRPGAPGLVWPEDIRRDLGSPLEYAKHCMLLAEIFVRSTGAHRGEAIEYLAALFMGADDVRFGRRALLAWGPDTGILDIYPLEVIEHVLESRPEFLPRSRFGRWLAPDDAQRFEMTAAPDLPLVLAVPEDMVVRGFAVKGGARPGYRFEPGLEAGTYSLTVREPGCFPLLVSARTSDGETLVDRLTVRVLGDPSPSASAPPRDADKIAAWPMPRVPDRIDLEADETTRPEVGLPQSEVARLQRFDALGGPKGEAPDPIFGLGRDAARAPIRTGAEPRHDGPLVPLEAPEDVRLSVAEAAVLRLALAAGATMADVQIVGAEPTDGNEITDLHNVWPDTAIEPVFDDPRAALALAERAQQALATGPSPLGTAFTDDFAAAEAEADLVIGPQGPPAEGFAEAAPDRGPRAADPAAPVPPSPPAPEPAPDRAANTIPDAPAVIGRPVGVVSGTQAQVPGDGGPTARIDLIADLIPEPRAESPADEPTAPDPAETTADET